MGSPLPQTQACMQNRFAVHARRLATCSYGSARPKYTQQPGACESRGQSQCGGGLDEAVRRTPCTQGVEWWEDLEGSRALASRWRPVREGAGADALAAGLAAGLAGVGAAAFLAAGFAAALDAAGAGVAAQHGHSITPRQSSLQMCSSQMPHTTPCDSGSSATKGVSSCRAAEQTLSSSSSSSSSSEAIANVKSGLVLEISS